MVVFSFGLIQILLQIKGPKSEIVSSVKKLQQQKLFS